MSDEKLPKVEVKARQTDLIASLLELDQKTTDPNSHYRWVSERPRTFGNAKIRGYTVVPKSEGVKTRAGYLDDRGDGLMWIQDVVLMKCDRAQWEARKKRETRQANRRLAAPKKQFRKRAKERKVRILTEEDE